MCVLLFISIALNFSVSALITECFNFCSKLSSSDSSKSLNNSTTNVKGNNAARNVYNNAQIPSLSNYTAKLRGNSNTVNSPSKKVSNPTQEFTKRQKNLIRAAVNGNTTVTPAAKSPSTPQSSNQLLAPMSELHLHDVPNSDLFSHDFQMQLSNYAAGGAKLAAAFAATRQSLSSTSQSNPEMTSVIFDPNGRPLPIADYNSDSEVSRISPPSLRLCKGAPPVKNGLDGEGNSSLVRSYNTLESMIESGVMDGRVQTALRSTYLARNVNSGKSGQRFWNGKGKPPPSRLPVRSQTKPFIVPQISKPPSTLYRGRSVGPQSSTNANLGRPSLVGATGGPTQVVIGSGGMVSIPANVLGPNMSRNYSSIDMSSTYPMNTSAYTSTHSMMSFQPLSVSQKPLLLPSQKELFSEPALNEEKFVNEEKLKLFEFSPPLKTRREVVRPQNSGRRSSKGRLSRKNSATIVKNDFVNGNRVMSGKSVPGKKKFKPKTQASNHRSGSKTTVNGTKMEENEIGDVPTFTTEVQDKITTPEKHANDNSLIKRSDVADYQMVLDADSLRKSVDFAAENL